MTHHTHDAGDTDHARMWDEMYSARPQVWSGRPNPQLVKEAEGLKPGKALDLGCGEGADSLWLAEQGWTVTAVDVSAVALERAREHASTSGHVHGGRISWEQHDLSEWTPEPEFALVSAQFLHSPALPWQQALATAAAGVAPGGTLLVVGHHPEHLPPGGSHEGSDMFFTQDDVVAELRLEAPQWQVEVCTVRERNATAPDGQDFTAGDAVVRATRLVTGT
ncbi:methyltransferase domain-containing protein [Pseudarthrobacter sp. J64]|uniref:class I SAM-dependent methyltransferase n=1 Tax=Pseudarthrobacter sp. J64 TaxID=3116485 RepID=UPI002E80D89F|nr:methyltransferase domain-containing protein [Pseudarthrobacter sp. J64]MEE2568791.1 methyltransferase domain-containing protein [Pseudarthrobacter sp. J64]